jgi:hypothetical protein
LKHIFKQHSPPLVHHCLQQWLLQHNEKLELMAAWHTRAVEELACAPSERRAVKHMGAEETRREPKIFVRSSLLDLRAWGSMNDGAGGGGGACGVLRADRRGDCVVHSTYSV